MTTNEQLELGFKGIQHRAPGGKHEDRMVRAAWWFAHMRRIVAGAMDWQAASQPEGNQSWFPGAQSK